MNLEKELLSMKDKIHNMKKDIKTTHRDTLPSSINDVPTTVPKKSVKRSGGKEEDSKRRKVDDEDGHCHISRFTYSYALSGVHIILRFPPTFIPRIASSHAGITILQFIESYVITQLLYEVLTAFQFHNYSQESAFPYLESFLYGEYE